MKEHDMENKFENVVICMYEQEKIKTYIEIIRKLKKECVKMCQEYFIFSYLKRCYNYMYKNNIIKFPF